MIEIVIEIVKNSPQWIVGTCLLIIVIGFQFRFNVKQKSTVKSAIINTRKIGKIEDKYIKKTQMKHVEDYLSDILIDCSANCRHFLIENNRASDETINSNETYKTYNTMIKSLLYLEVKPRIREEFDDLCDYYNIDNLRECTLEEINGGFTLYKQKTIKNILSNAREYMSNNWLNCKDLSRSEGLTTIDFNLVSISLDKSFDFAIKTQLDFFRKIKELESEIK